MSDKCEVKREKQIPSQLKRLDNALGDLKEAIDGLEEGLSLVLRSPEPACETCEADSNPGCGLAEEIAGHRRRVAKLVESARAMKDRLEV